MKRDLLLFVSREINQYIMPALGIIQPFLFLEKPSAC